MYIFLYIHKCVCMIQHTILIILTICQKMSICKINIYYYIYKLFTAYYIHSEISCTLIHINYLDSRSGLLK